MQTIGQLSPSPCSLGCNNFGMGIDRDVAFAVVEAALEGGITSFDTASSYGGGLSEEWLGQVLGSRRDSVVITTKFHSGSRDGVLSSLEESLRRLRTDRVDLFLIHKPDASVPVGETLAALASARDAGKVLEIGCSNFTADQLREAAQAARQLGVGSFVNAQNRYSLLERQVEDEVVPEILRQGMTLNPYFPLASGMLTGKYTRDNPSPEGTRFASWKGADKLDHYVDEIRTDRNFDVVERLDAYARSHGHTLVELALSWVAGAPAVASVLVGATSPRQATANAAAVGAWRLTAQERAEVDALISEVSIT